MIVDVVRCQKSGDNIVNILQQPVTPDEVRFTSVWHSYFKVKEVRWWPLLGEFHVASPEE